MNKPDKKRGLGRGLSALMSDVALTEPNAENRRQQDAIKIPIETIFPNPDQPRKQFTESHLEDLASSIREKGIIQPLLLRRVGEADYQIVAGERRWRAAQKAGLHEVPAIVRDFSDSEVIEIAIIENIQRQDLNAIEEARGYKYLMDQFGHTQEKLSEALGKSRSHIANLIRLLQLPNKILDMVEEGALTAGHARTLVTAENPEQIALQIISRGLSVRDTEKLVKKGAEQKQPTVGKRNEKTGKDADTLALEGDLTASLGMPVKIVHDPKNENGVITIKYQNLDELDEFCRIIGGG